MMRRLAIGAMALLAGPAVAAAPVPLAGIGLVGPECARYDQAGGGWIVANLGQRGAGAPANDGFLTRLDPDGRVTALKWVAGGRDGAVLDDPLGIAIDGDVVHVADTATVRSFDRVTGRPVRSVPVPGAVRLNDIAAARDGTLYVTDSAADDVAGAIYRITPQGRVSLFAARDAALERPNGIAVMSDGTIVHGGRGVNLVVREPRRGRIVREITLPTGRIDGIVALPGGALLVASQDGHVVYRVDAAGRASVVAKDIPIPAAIGLDPVRQRLMVPQIAAATLTLVDLAP